MILVGGMIDTFVFVAALLLFSVLLLIITLFLVCIILRIIRIRGRHNMRIMFIRRIRHDRRLSIRIRISTRG